MHIGEINSNINLQKGENNSIIYLTTTWRFIYGTNRIANAYRLEQQ